MSVNPPSDPDEPQDGSRAGGEEPTRPLDETGDAPRPLDESGDAPGPLEESGDATRPLEESGDATRPLDEGAEPSASGADAQPFGAAPAPASQDGGPTDPYGADTPAGASTYSRPSYAHGDDDGEGTGEAAPKSKGPLILMIVGVVVLIAAVVVAAVAFFGRDDADPAPGSTASSEASTEASVTPSADPTTEESTTDEPTPTPTTSGDLLRQLDTSVSAGGATFTLTEAGFAPEPGIIESGAVEAYLGTYSDGTTEIQLLATAWPSVEEADAYAAAIIENLGVAEEVATGETYQNGMGTFWAYILEDGTGMYLWTTDRGEVLRVTGPTDWVGPFYSNYSL